MHPLDSAKSKIERAKTHIRSLNRAISKHRPYVDTNFTEKSELGRPTSPLGYIVEGARICEVDIDPRIEQNWSLIVGDILTNLRASLDHVAWALATKHACDQGRKLCEGKGQHVYFPLKIQRAKNPSLGGLSKKDLDPLPPEAHKTVESFQPYNGTNRDELRLLGALDYLNNEGKHRRVTPVLREISVDLTGKGQPTTTRLNKPHRLQFLVTDSTRNNIDTRTDFDVVLNVPFLRPNHFSVSEFSKLHEFIRDEVIPAFECFF